MGRAQSSISAIEDCCRWVGVYLWALGECCQLRPALMGLVWGCAPLWLLGAIGALCCLGRAIGARFLCHMRARLACRCSSAGLGCSRCVIWARSGVRACAHPLLPMAEDGRECGWVWARRMCRRDWRSPQSLRLRAALGVCTNGGVEAPREFLGIAQSFDEGNAGAIIIKRDE